MVGLAIGDSHYGCAEAGAALPPITHGAKMRGFGYCKDAEAAVPFSYPEGTDVAAPPFHEGFVRHEVKDGAALALERENSCGSKAEAVVTLSDRGVSFWKDALSVVREGDAAAENGVSHCKNVEALFPTFDKGISYSCKTAETAVPILEEGASCCLIKEPVLEEGASCCLIKEPWTPSSERGAFYCIIEEAAAPTPEKEEIFVNVTTDTPAPTASDNGVSPSKIKGAASENEALVDAVTEIAALTSTSGPSQCKSEEEVVPTLENKVFGNTSAETAAPTSKNGVSYYDIGFPDVLCPPTDQITDDAKVTLYAYIVHYSILQEGQDPIDVSAPTQFVLLNHFPLDDEVAHHFSVRLNLPHRECVVAHLIPSDVICLTPHRVNIMEVFNGLLFSFMLGRNIMDIDEDFHTAEYKRKGYYIMPLNDGFDLKSKAKVAIDWTTAFDLVHSKINLKKWMHYHATPIPDMNDQLFEGNEATAKECLILKSGFYREEDLIDAFVTYGPWNLRCFIIGISKELCGLSLMEGNDCCLSYKDYWLKRFNLELKYGSQPLLIGYSLSRAEALWCKAKAKRVLVPPEICILQMGLKGKLWRGAFRLPSILCGLENALLAAQLRDRIGPWISVFKVQEALTSGAYNVYQSYERLELVGDSFLTLLGVTALYMKDSLMNRNDLASSLHSLVENKRLFRCAEACGLASYVFNEPFPVKEWVPPGLVPKCLYKAQMGFSRKQRISWRTLADVVEAIVGAYAMDGSLADVLKAMSWLKVAIEYPWTVAGGLLSGSAAMEGSLISRCQIADLEKLLKYSFKNHDLVSTAVCYHSTEDDGGLQFSRLAYLGDCILSHYVARHLVMEHHSLDVGTINEMKQSVINKENLACAAIRNKLHVFITGITPSHEESIVAYASTFEKESSSAKMLSAYGLMGLCAPKGLCDLISSIAAAIYLDCELDSELVWKIIRPFLEPLPVPGSFSLHPINELTQFCKARHLQLHVDSTFHSGLYKTNVIVDDENVANFEHEDKRYARKHAAVKALHQLKLWEMER